MGRSVGHGLNGANEGERKHHILREYPESLWIWIIVWRVQFIFWEFRFGVLLPYILVMLLWGCRGKSHASCLPSTEPMSCTLTFTCLSAQMRVRQLGVPWSRVIGIHHCKEYGQINRDLTRVSDSWPLRIFAGLLHFHHFRTRLTKLIFVQCKVSLWEFHALLLAFPWTLRMWHKSSPWFPGGLTSLYYVSGNKVAWESQAFQAHRLIHKLTSVPFRLLRRQMFCFQVPSSHPFTQWNPPLPLLPVISDTIQSLLSPVLSLFTQLHRQIIC